MDEYSKEIVVPILWKDWDDIITNVIYYYNVKFYEDFGIFVKDETYALVIVDYENGEMRANDLIQKFKAIPIC